LGVVALLPGAAVGLVGVELDDEVVVGPVAVDSEVADGSLRIGAGMPCSVWIKRRNWRSHSLRACDRASAAASALAPGSPRLLRANVRRSSRETREAAASSWVMRSIGQPVAARSSRVWAGVVTLIPRRSTQSNRLAVWTSNDSSPLRRVGATTSVTSRTAN
jgi:hypothetical protein